MDAAEMLCQIYIPSTESEFQRSGSYRKAIVICHVATDPLRQKLMCSKNFNT